VTFLLDAMIFLGAAIVVVPICKRLGLSVVLGYLAAGLLIGPSAIGLIGAMEEATEVMHFAEIGVVFLLFIIGLELQPRRLWVMRRLVFGLGTAQVGLTAAVLAAVLAIGFGLSWTSSALLGFALALSSTAFVLQLLSERKALNQAHGRAAFGILLLQDVAVIPAIAVLDLVNPQNTGEGTWLDALLVVGLVIGGLVLARLLLRPLLRFVAATGIHELFIAAALALVVGSALAMQALELSMGLGAFLAGMMVADSEYRHQLESDVEPFKGLLLGLFFMAVGMSVDLKLLFDMPLLIFALAAALMIVKALLIYPMTRLTGLDHNESVRAGTVLSQGGEFAFVLLTAGLLAGLIEPELAAISVLVVTLSMALTPAFGAIAEKLLVSGEPPKEFDEIEEEANPVVIAGFGRVGQVIGRILSMRRIPFTALEVSSHQVEFVRGFGNKIYYGDPTNMLLLRSAHIEKARALVIAVDDEEAALKIASEVRSHFPNTRILARARNRQHELKLRDIGVHFVIRDTLESTLRLGTELLGELGMGKDQAQAAIDVFRDHDAAVLERQMAIYHDDEAFRAVTRDAARELEELFDEDAAAGKPLPGDPRL
jgi:glutathione-regulated potassium-efflux system ancillary protein KefC/glutathione-regulated potassium-efflux system protein KefB